MRRFSIAVIAAVTLGTALTSVPAQAHTARPSPGLAHCTTGTCHFDVPPGTYDVRVVVGGKDRVRDEHQRRNPPLPAPRDGRTGG